MISRGHFKNPIQQEAVSWDALHDAKKHAAEVQALAVAGSLQAVGGKLAPALVGAILIFEPLETTGEVLDEKRVALEKGAEREEQCAWVVAGYRCRQVEGERRGLLSTGGGGGPRTRQRKSRRCSRRARSILKTTKDLAVEHEHVGEVGKDVGQGFAVQHRRGEEGGGAAVVFRMLLEKRGEKVLFDLGQDGHEGLLGVDQLLREQLALVAVSLALREFFGRRSCGRPPCSAGAGTTVAALFSRSGGWLRQPVTVGV